MPRLTEVRRSPTAMSCPGAFFCAAAGTFLRARRNRVSNSADQQPMMPFVSPAAASEASLETVALLRRLGKGEPEALDQIYRRESASVYRYALALSGNPAWAADAMQDAFVSLAAKPTGFDPLRGTLGAYLAGIARPCLDATLARTHGTGSRERGGWRRNAGLARRPAGARPEPGASLGRAAGACPGRSARPWSWWTCSSGPMPRQPALPPSRSTPCAPACTGRAFGWRRT